MSPEFGGTDDCHNSDPTESPARNEKAALAG